MTPTNTQLPLADYASGIRNADRASGRGLGGGLAWLVFKTFFLGLLSGAAVATGLALYFHKP